MPGVEKTKKGKLDLAQGGTLFIEEIADMNPLVQSKLLRYLQEKKYQRIGGSDFIVVTAPSTGEALARRLVERSEALMTQLSELGGGAKAPVLVVAVAPTEGTRDSVEIGKRLGQAMKMAKAAGTPGFVVWAPPAA